MQQSYRVFGRICPGRRLSRGRGQPRAVGVASSGHYVQQRPCKRQPHTPAAVAPRPSHAVKGRASDGLACHRRQPPHARPPLSVDARVLRDLEVIKAGHNLDTTVTEGSLATIREWYNIPTEHGLHVNGAPSNNKGRKSRYLFMSGPNRGFRLDWLAYPIGNVPPYLSEEESVLVGRLKEFFPLLL
ncbi:hypothetical protein B296_00043572 [Ensete ventricosum]|uniref:Uncharacterized protein n=1 Tax=Ensete ventricosum TaxID=4639 RepID=A0A426ZE00_ENSVE|nr:hypothetical protein B296_00043572 [Ensete ventricosum]